MRYGVVTGREWIDCNLPGGRRAENASVDTFHFVENSIRTACDVPTLLLHENETPRRRRVQSET